MSEFDWIARYFAPLARGVGAAGLSDDVAALSGKAQVITVDALVEGVHFLPTDPIGSVAQKLVAVNVSDIIAKGAFPDEALLTLGWPKARSEAELAVFAEALGGALDRWGARLIGGDTVTSPSGLFLSLTLTGRLPEGGGIIRRSGAKAGDMIWVSGEIGWGGIGLEAALAGRDDGARARYLVPDVPQLGLVGVISAYANASMDVSDGLLGDLEKLCAASDVAGHLNLDAVLLPKMASGGQKSDEARLKTALKLCTAGDDYQVLFTAPESAQAALREAGFGLSCIGHIEAGAGLRAQWQGQAVQIPKRLGFAH